MFLLEKYKGSKTRHTCPNCGRTRCFTYYVDDYGEMLHPNVGRCNHESSCGYHYTPKEFFKDYPQFKDAADCKSLKSNSLFKMRPPKKINTISLDYVKRSVRPEIDSDFTSFLRSILTSDQVATIIDDYQLGVTSNGDVIFFEIDIEGRCRTGKIMKYDRATGHRIKDEFQPNRINWVHSELKRIQSLPSDWNLTQCLFGEHLLKRYPDKTVVIVEAEKTAVICSAFMPEYVWLATGGKSQLNDRVCVLKGRKVFAFPDLDAIDDWKRKAASFPEVNIRVSSILSQFSNVNPCEENIDIADWVIEWAKKSQK